ncbi:hypothetical protein GPJ56_000338 [Histomonas meleagridis]|uniref:uncharacterized protein n=1 Tax=Histomonas meleagridis TaxID=135588 RepID=UPI003559F057|nr:hypothetical protein GPJ56_000338 [Histomonas meleagridis]KAH0798389.1 hypothetical protein GO595_008781 [Histomonas meleagridis]
MDATTKQRKSPLRYIIPVIVLILAIILYFILRKPKFVRQTGTFPFIWNRDLNISVHNYLSRDPANHVLIVTGPYKTGKSRLLDILSKKIISNKGLPISVHVENTNTVEEVVDSIKISAIKSLSLLSEVLSPSEVQNLGSLSVIPKPNRTLFTDLSLSRAYHLIEDAADSLLTQPEDFLNLISRFNPIVKPYIFVYHADKLPKLKTIDGRKLGSHIFNVTYHRLLNRAQYSEFVPFVVELTNSLHSLKSKRLGEMFEFAFTAPIQNTLEKVHVTNRLFTSQEAAEIIKKFGGHGGSLAYVYEEMQTYESFEDSMKIVKEKIDYEMNKLMIKPDHPVWYQFCVSKGEVPWVNISKVRNNAKIVGKMIRSGYLAVNASKVVSVANPAVLEYICAHSKKVRHIETPKPKPIKKKPVKNVEQAIVNISNYVEENITETKPLIIINETIEEVNETIPANVTLDVNVTNQTIPIVENQTEVINVTTHNDTVIDNQTITVPNVTIDANISNQTISNETILPESNVTETINQTVVKEEVVNQTTELNQTNTNKTLDTNITTDANVTSVNQTQSNETSKLKKRSWFGRGK